MKKRFILFVGFLLIVCNGCNIQNSDLTSLVVNTPSPMSEAQKNQNDILSKNYDLAAKTLEKAIAEKDRKIIRLGLKNPILPIRQKAAEATAEIGDIEAVPPLIDALEFNRGIMAGGTEAQIMQNDLNKAIISALEELTKLKFMVSDEISAEDVRKVIERSREWWKDNQPNPSDLKN